MRSKKKNNINWGHKVKEKFDLILGLLTFISVLLFDRIDWVKNNNFDYNNWDNSLNIFFGQKN